MPAFVEEESSPFSKGFDGKFVRVKLQLIPSIHYVKFQLAQDEAILSGFHVSQLRDGCVKRREVHLFDSENSWVSQPFAQLVHLLHEPLIALDVYRVLVPARLSELPHAAK